LRLLIAKNFDYPEEVKESFKIMRLGLESGVKCAWTWMLKSVEVYINCILLLIIILLSIHYIVTVTIVIIQKLFILLAIVATEIT
jgi:predicted membrane chloride channel (bestrophin family)